MEALAGREESGAGTGANQKHERRRIIRQRCRVQIELIVRCTLGAGNEWSVNTINVKGKLLDLSDDGAMIFTKEAFVDNQELRVTLYLPDEAPVVTLAGVRWCKPLQDKGGNASGIRFRNMHPKGIASVKRFLQRLSAGEFASE